MLRHFKIGCDLDFELGYNEKAEPKIMWLWDCYMSKGLVQACWNLSTAVGFSVNAIHYTEAIQLCLQLKKTQAISVCCYTEHTILCVCRCIVLLQTSHHMYSFVNLLCSNWPEIQQLIYSVWAYSFCLYLTVVKILTYLFLFTVKCQVRLWT